MAGKNREKDQLMAARMKVEKIERTSARCCICYAIVNLSQLYVHLAFHRPY